MVFGGLGGKKKRPFQEISNTDIGTVGYKDEVVR